MLGRNTVDGRLEMVEYTISLLRIYDAVNQHDESKKHSTDSIKDILARDATEHHTWDRLKYVRLSAMLGTHASRIVRGGVREVRSVALLLPSKTYHNQTPNARWTSYICAGRHANRSVRDDAQHHCRPTLIV